jgi:hypothetical protein
MFIPDNKIAHTEKENSSRAIRRNANNTLMPTNSGYQLICSTYRRKKKTSKKLK